jgi:hypothetical protein
MILPHVLETAGSSQRPAGPPSIEEPGQHAWNQQVHHWNPTTRAAPGSACPPTTAWPQHEHPNGLLSSCLVRLCPNSTPMRGCRSRDAAGPQILAGRHVGCRRCSCHIDKSRTGQTKLPCTSTSSKRSAEAWSPVADSARSSWPSPIGSVGSQV